MKKLGICMGWFVMTFWLARCAGQQLTQDQQRALDLFECRVAALQPYVGSIYDTAEVVREFGQGRLDLTQLMSTLGYSQPVIMDSLVSWLSCEPLTAPASAPGNKVL